MTKTVTAVNLHGKFFEANTPRADKYWNSKIDFIKSRRDHCKKGSRKWLKLHRIYCKLEKKKSNQIRDFQHKLSKKMVENTKANTLIVGDIKVKKMVHNNKGSFKQRKQNRSSQNQGYLARFIGFLAYKAELRGKKVIRIDESYTSKACHNCGKLHDMPLLERTMICYCGIVIDRDRNSSINIMKKFLLQNALWTGYQHFVDNLRQTESLMNNYKNTVI